MKLNEAVRSYMENNGIKQSHVAERLGWTPQKMSAVLSGKQRMEADTLGDICDALGKPYDYFYKVVRIAS